MNDFNYKVPFNILLRQVDFLYEKEFPLCGADRAIEQHCEEIESFIRACGWDDGEFMNRTLAEEKVLNPAPIVFN